MRAGDVSTALSALGIAYTVRGEEAVAQCPAHDDRKPSWSCNLETGAHHCFSCGFGGSFVYLVRFIRNVTTDSAEEWCRGFLKTTDQIATILDRREEPKQIRQYSESDLALFTDPPLHARQGRNLTWAACRAYGVLWDHGSWILPIRDPYTGKLWGYQQKGSESFRNRPTGVRKSDTLFGMHLVPEGGSAILVESPLDAVRLLSAGFPGAVASYGAAVSTRQVELLEARCDSLLVALDSDDAGQVRAGKLGREAAHRFRPMRFFDYGDTNCKDPGEMTDDQIRYGIDRAYSAILARL